MSDAPARAKRIDWKVLLGIAPAVVVAAAIIAATLLLTGSTLNETAAIVAISAIVILVAALARRFDVVDRNVDRAFAAWFWFCLWALAGLLPLVVLRFLSEYILIGLPLWIQISALVAWLLLLGYTLLLIATEAKRERLFDVLEKLGLLAPVLYSLNVLMFAVLLFASVTYLLATYGLVRIAARTGQPVTMPGLLDFFVWHFLEAVPSLKVNQTLRWEEPWTYDSAAVGWILLLFKLVVIVPVIGAFLGYWKRRTSPAPK